MTQTTDQDLIVNSDINNIIESLATNHKGASAPSYAKAGMLWLDDSTADMALKIYDGANWALIGRIETQSEFNIGAEDQKVKISATDQNAAELIHKLVAGSGIEMSVINQGLDEKILLDVSDVIHQAIADAATLDIATTTEAIAGTNDTKVMTPLKVKEALGTVPSMPLTQYYESNAVQLTSDGGQQLTFPHGLGEVPKFLDVTFVCLESDGGWAVGDEVSHQHNNYTSDATRSFGLSVGRDTSVVSVTTAVSGNYLFNKQGTAFTPISSRWGIKVRAWA